MNRVKGLLKNWYPFGDSIAGEIHDDKDKRFDDGTTIRTSTVQGDMTTLKEGDVIETVNSRYLLGKKGGCSK